MRLSSLFGHLGELVENLQSLVRTRVKLLGNLNRAGPLNLFAGRDRLNIVRYRDVVGARVRAQSDEPIDVVET